MARIIFIPLEKIYLDYSKFSYLTRMSEDENLVRVYTGSDFLASLLKVELEEKGFETKIRSDKDAGLHAGFASSGFAQVYVSKEKLVEVEKLVEAFKEKMK
jgi:hypothetical protein